MLFEGDWKTIFEGINGGVCGRKSFIDLCGDLDRGGELTNVSSYCTDEIHNVTHNFNSLHGSAMSRLVPMKVDELGGLLDPVCDSGYVSGAPELFDLLKTDFLGLTKGSRFDSMA